MAEPPLLAGAFHVSVTVLLPATAEVIVGAPGRFAAVVVVVVVVGGRVVVVVVVAGRVVVVVGGSVVVVAGRVVVVVAVVVVVPVDVEALIVFDAADALPAVSSAVT